MPIAVTTLKMRQQCEASKALRVASTAVRTTPIPVTVGTFETQRKLWAKSDDSYEDDSFEASRTTTVARMATLKDPIPVTVDSFEALGVVWGIPLGAGLANREPGSEKGFRA